MFFDNNSSSPIDPQVAKIVTEEIQHLGNNPLSQHLLGQNAAKKLHNARNNIAKKFNCNPMELIFTSGGTEGINIILQGIFANSPGGFAISSDLEHLSIIKTLQNLENDNKCSPILLSPKTSGAVSPQLLLSAIDDDTKAIVLTASNNETGIMTNINDIANIAKSRNIILVIDFISYFGREIFENIPGISAFAISGHKIHGPQGSGLIYLKNDIAKPIIGGGGQENNFRSGSHNLPGILGIEKAIDIIFNDERSIVNYIRNIRDYFENEIQKKIPGIIVNGIDKKRVSNVSNISFDGINNEVLFINLDMNSIYTSIGAACSSGSSQKSRVLSKMQLPHNIVSSSVRFSFSRFNTIVEIDNAIKIIKNVVEKLRKKQIHH